MKNEKLTMSKAARLLAMALVLAAAVFAIVISCKDDDGGTHTHEWEWKVTTVATATADGLETETCKTCGAESGNTRIIEQTEPPVKEFLNQTMFVDTDNNTSYFADIIDARTAAGKQTLEQLGIVSKLQGATSEAYTAAINPIKGRFRNVFNPGLNPGGVTIYVDNPTTFYKAKAPDGNTIYFHIDYLASLSDANLQTVINSLITAMNPANPTVPIEITKAKDPLHGHAKVAAQQPSAPRSGVDDKFSTL